MNDHDGEQQDEIDKLRAEVDAGAAFVRDAIKQVAASDHLSRKLQTEVKELEKSKDADWRKFLDLQHDEQIKQLGDKLASAELQVNTLREGLKDIHEDASQTTVVSSAVIRMMVTKILKP